MPRWPYRYQLSLQDRVRRSVYELLRDQMDTYLVTHALIESYENLRSANEPYPFVTKRELKPRARVVEKENILHNHFLVIFCEGTVSNSTRNTQKTYAILTIPGLNPWSWTCYPSIMPF
jgi:hypothetical protein